ncbi:ATP-binding protein [Streptomyces sp. NPDC001815]|uniref:ATP-binding protein n=1 Tax=Streptomyces sp. NPDC001815 TaxID=3154526 RepID=UPI00333266AA
MTGVADEAVLRRHFVAIATADYDDPHWQPQKLPVDDEVRVMRDWLCARTLGPRRFTPLHPHLADNPTLTDISRALQNPEPHTRWREADAAVVYITGHGTIADETHWSVLQRTTKGSHTGTAQRTGQLITWLAESGIEHLLVIVDECYAEKLSADLVQQKSKLPSGWLILPSAARDEEADSHALTTAISEFLKDVVACPDKYTGPLLRVEEFVVGVQRKLGRELYPLGPQLYGPHPCLPNPAYPHAPGDEEDEKDAFGRHSLMHRLFQAAAGPPQALVVTGCAGSGKSAALAQLAAHGGSYRVDAFVDAAGLSGTEVMARIFAALAIPAPGLPEGSPSPQEWLDAWADWHASASDPVTVVVDAPDEAADPDRLLQDLLSRLEPPHTRHRRLRLIVGMRSPNRAETVGSEPAAHTLADRTEALLHAERVRLDEPPYLRREDMAACVRAILLSDKNSPYAEQESLANQVARAIADAAGPSYLIARAAAGNLTARDRAVDPLDRKWRAVLTEGFVGIFRDDLLRIFPDPGDRLVAVELLHAVAYAYGRGMPRQAIWPVIANAVSSHSPSHPYGDKEIAWLLASRAGAYLTTDQEDGMTLYRLFHDTLREVITGHWRDLVGEAPDRQD